MRDSTTQVKRARLTKEAKDDGNYHVAQVNYFGKTCDVEVLTPYGLYSNLPKDGVVTLWSVQGQEENRVGIGNTPKTRYKNLRTGEVVVGSPAHETKIEFLTEGVVKVIGKNNATITIDASGNISVNTDGTLTLSSQGNMTLSSDADINVTASGDVVIDGANIELNGSGTPLSTDTTVQTN